ncbi:MAG: hypothetical protein LLG01_01170 [Planctomycetaceae bacterium]|nr:hypothetical protein [Planctomycetaceae bacterium]
MNLTCLSKVRKGETFTLTYEGGVFTLKGADGAPVLEETGTEFFAKRFQFPSFADSTKYPRIMLNEGLMEFQMGSAEIKGLRTLRDLLLAKADPTVWKRIFLKGVLTVIGGFLAIAGGIAISILSMQNPDSKGQSTIYYGLPIFGVAIVVTGFVKIAQSKRVKKLAAEA